MSCEGGWRNDLAVYISGNRRDGACQQTSKQDVLCLNSIKCCCIFFLQKVPFDKNISKAIVTLKLSRIKNNYKKLRWMLAADRPSAVSSMQNWQLDFNFIPSTVIKLLHKFKLVTLPPQHGISKRCTKPATCVTAVLWNAQTQASVKGDKRSLFYWCW